MVDIIVVVVSGKSETGDAGGDVDNIVSMLGVLLTSGVGNGSLIIVNVVNLIFVVVAVIVDW